MEHSSIEHAASALVLCFHSWGCSIIYLLMMFKLIFTLTRGMQKPP